MLQVLRCLLFNNGFLFSATEEQRSCFQCIKIQMEVSVSSSLKRFKMPCKDPRGHLCSNKELETRLWELSTACVLVHTWIRNVFFKGGSYQHYQLQRGLFGNPFSWVMTYLISKGEQGQVVTIFGKTWTTAVCIWVCNYEGNITFVCTDNLTCQPKLKTYEKHYLSFTFMQFRL